jgi:hypothetical protein
MSNDILEKVVATSETDADKKGGFLAPAQVNQFIDYMFDQTVLGSQVRKETIRSDSAELTRIGVGQRLLRRATEAVDDGVNVGVAFSKIALSTSKFRLDWELSTESLEDGREGTDFEDHIARLMAAQVANDMEDYAINGNTVDVATDPGVGTMPGWGQRLRATAHVYDAAGANLDRNVLSAMMKAVPRHHKQGRGRMKYFASSNALQDLLDSEVALAASVNQLVDNQYPAGPLGYTAPRINGQIVQEVPFLGDDKVGTYSGATAAEAVHSEVWLTDPQNLIWAVKREIQVYREFKPKKDSIEYTLYTRFGTAVENGDAAVIATNVAVK